MITIALFGAAGKMGRRISEKLKDDSNYRMLYVEANEDSISRLSEQGLEATPGDQAAKEADVVILAVPDNLIGNVAKDIVPLLRNGAMLMCLDPAAVHAGELPERKDISYFVVHPCHPPVVNDETDPEARMDFFGGYKAKQNIVCALAQGNEKDYHLGEQIARKMFAPVMNAHRITVEQMAILEPAMAETVTLTCMMVIREALDEAMARGVPTQAAWDFMMGHINANIGILFGFMDARVSDGAKLAVERAKSKILQPDWKKVFDPENILAEVRSITQSKK
ncbi:MAG: phosphogluconate dehydrogenase C-terminal domain-containing protein [bacterium]